jgi:protein-tyrosine-phosphatase
MAEGLFKAFVQEDGEIWQVASAGIYAQPGFPAAQYTRDVLLEKGVDLSSHQSRPVSAEMIEATDLILTMEQGQKEALQAAFPRHASRIFLLSEMAGEYRDIADPIGRPIIEFRETAQEIESFLARGKERIQMLCKMSEESHGE